MIKKVAFFTFMVVLLACNKTETITETDHNGFKITFERDKISKRKDGKFTKFYASGAKNEECVFQQDSLQGERKLFYENGQVQVVENYKNNRYEGNYKSFYENGTVEQEGLYVNNQMSGEWKTYYKNGQLKEVVTFAHNLENGPFREFFENGKLKTEGTYSEGDTEVGELKEYHVSGQLIRISNCVGGACKTTWMADTTKMVLQ
jgi:antitoxin component YwqK of YwqJK toxin-antitoxin module